MAATFLALSPVSAFAANKVQFVLHNGNVEGWEVRLLHVAVLPQATVVTGVAPSEWTLRRRTGTTTPPSGTGGITPALMDTQEPTLKAGITVWNAPQVAPAGGTLETFCAFIPQADELKLSTLDAPTMASLNAAQGMTIYSAAFDGLGATPLTLRQNQTLELVQSATGGTGNCRIRALFLIGAM